MKNPPFSRTRRYRLPTAVFLWACLCPVSGFADQKPVAAEAKAQPAPGKPASASALGDTTRLPRAVTPANFDTTTAPCHDFFQYVNGGWIKRAEIPEGNTQLRAMDESWAITKSGAWKVAEALRVAALTTTDSTTQAIGYFYGSCLLDTTGTAQGTLGSERRRSYCVTETNSYFNHVVTQTHLQDFLRRELPIRTQTQSLFHRLKGAAVERIRTALWLPDSIKPLLWARLATMWLDVLPPENMYVDPVSSRYTGPRLTPADFRENLTRLSKPGRTRYGFQPQSPEYKELTNKVEITHALFLQPPFADFSGDPASNYGALGYILGHEISHAFDVTRLRKLLGDVDHPIYQRGIAQLAAQYAALGETGRSNLDENLADLAGVLIAYDAFEQAQRDKFSQAWQARPAQNVGPGVIDGLTPEQRFFVAFANVYRAKGQPTVVFDQHSAAVTRVNGVLPNIPAFAKAFDCNAGDAMTRPSDQRVAIW